MKKAKTCAIPLRQSYIHIARKRLIKAGRYSHARQMRRAKKERDKIKTYLGRLYRDIQRKIKDNDFQRKVFKELFEIVEKVLAQKKDSKNKIYSLHEPHVECISKGKFHEKYEFGCKVSLVITHKEGLAAWSSGFTWKPV